MRRISSSVYLCWQPQALEWPGFLEVLGLRFLWRIKSMFFFLRRRAGCLCTCVWAVPPTFHPPHVNRCDWHSCSNPNPRDCSSDVKVMKTGGSPYQQPTSYLGRDIEQQWYFYWNFCLAKNAIEVITKAIRSSLTRGMQSRQMAARLPNLCTRLTLFFQDHGSQSCRHICSHACLYFK